MTTAITSTTIESNAYDNVYSYLNDRSKIADPRNPGGYSGRQFVHTIDPFMTSMRFEDVPYIVLEFPTVEYSRISVNGKHKNIGWKHRIVVRTARDGASGANTGNTPIGFSDMKSICDDIHELFNSETNKAAFRLLSMYSMNITKVSVDVGVIEGKAVYVAEFELTYETRMAVTS